MSWVKEKLTSPVFWGVVATAAVAGFGLWVAGFEHYDENWALRSNWEHFRAAAPNEIGDTLAGFAGALAFVWIIVTVWLQSNELAAQREELRLTRDEMAEQRLERLVFELIATYNHIVQGMDLRRKVGGEVFRQGRDCFKYFFEEISDACRLDKMYPESGATDSSAKAYEDMYKEHSSDLAHYFRFVHNMLRIVETSEIAKPEHKKLIRSLFSNEELLVLFYNAQSEAGKPMVPFIESFELFDNLPKDRLIHPEHRTLLSAKCFGDYE